MFYILVELPLVSQEGPCIINIIVSNDFESCGGEIYKTAVLS
jgi:hypothetical protein